MVGRRLEYAFEPILLLQTPPHPTRPLPALLRVAEQGVRQLLDVQGGVVEVHHPLPPQVLPSSGGAAAARARGGNSSPADSRRPSRRPAAATPPTTAAAPPRSRSSTGPTTSLGQAGAFGPEHTVPEPPAAAVIHRQRRRRPFLVSLPRTHGQVNAVTPHHQRRAMAAMADRGLLQPLQDLLDLGREGASTPLRRSRRRRGVGREMKSSRCRAVNMAGLFSGCNRVRSASVRRQRGDVQGDDDDGGNHGRFLQRGRGRDDSPGCWDVITRGLRWAAPAEAPPCGGSRLAAPTCTSGRGNPAAQVAGQVVHLAAGELGQAKAQAALAVEHRLRPVRLLIAGRGVRDGQDRGVVDDILTGRAADEVGGEPAHR